MKMIKRGYGTINLIKTRKRIMIDNGEMSMLKKARADLVYLMFRLLVDG
jgi:hypothetical protein